MELKRGKTFIKSSLQISHEKLPDPAATAEAREDAGSWSVSLRAQQRPHCEKGSEDSSSSQGYDRCPNKGAQPDPERCSATFKLVRKSKTHESVLGAGRAATTTGQMVGSASFPGPSSSQRMIDYRHFVPQMPFVPAVAKSIPRKRISLKRPKKCFRNLFHIRRNKTENLSSLTAKGKSLSSPGDPLDVAMQRGKTFFSLGEGLELDDLCQDLSDSEFLPDSSFDLCNALCEDVASLKSFDSLTGCGEIFADESSVPSLELSEGPESPAPVFQVLESKEPRGPSQDSVEQLASPAQNEVLDFTKFWDNVTRSVRQQQRALLAPWLVGPQDIDTDQPRLDANGLVELPLFPYRGPHSGSKASSIDTGTPKSEQPESVSTSDEGYYDSFSPGLDEDKKEAPSPGTAAAAFPRDSYSGDALYELFYDPSKSPVGPSLDDDLCVSESLSGPALGTPLSMCSFHVGAEENLAPAPGPDLLSQGFLQSSWKGKECLLKLCDTELAITMGIVNWLRRAPPAPIPAPGEPTASSGPQRAPKGPAEKLGDSGDQASDAGRATVCSAPSRQQLCSLPGTKSLLVRESAVPGETARGTGTPSKNFSLEKETQGYPNSLLSSVGSSATTRDYSSKSKAPIPTAYPVPSQKEPGSPENLRHSQRLWRPGHEASSLDVGPSLAGYVAQVVALQIHPDSQPPRQDAGSGPFRQSQAWGSDILQQKQASSSPNGTAVCGLPNQDQRFPGLTLNLSQLKLEPARLGVQTCASTDDQPLQLSPRPMAQATHRVHLDSESALAPTAGQNHQGYPPEILGLTLDSQL